MVTHTHHHHHQLERQIAQQHRQIQRLSRKLEQLSSIGRVPTSNGDEEVTAEDKCAKVHDSSLTG